MKKPLAFLLLIPFAVTSHLFADYTPGHVLFVSQLHKRVYVRFDEDKMLDVGSDVRIDTNRGNINTEIVFSGKNITIVRSEDLEALKKVREGDQLKSSGKVIFTPPKDERERVDVMQPMSYIGTPRQSLNLAAAPDPSKFKEYQRIDDGKYAAFSENQKKIREERLKKKGTKEQAAIDPKTRFNKYQHVKDSKTDFTMKPIQDGYLKHDMAQDELERKARVRRLKAEEEDRRARLLEEKRKIAAAKKNKSKYKTAATTSSSSKSLKSTSVGAGLLPNMKLKSKEDTSSRKAVRKKTKADYSSYYKNKGTAKSKKVSSDNKYMNYMDKATDSQPKRVKERTASRTATMDAYKKSSASSKPVSKGDYSTKVGQFSTKQWFDKAKTMRQDKFKIEYLSNAIAGFPDYYEARLELGKVYMKLKIHELAVEEFNTAINIDPKNGKAYNLLAEHYKTLKDYDKAILTIKKGIQANPKMAILYCTAGEIYEAQGQTNLAIQQYNRALSDPRWGSYARKRLTKLQK